MSYNEFVTPDEQHVIGRLIAYATGRRWLVSVYDGLEWTGERLQPARLPAYLATAGDDMLRFTDEDGNYLGRMWLIYGNSGEELIADYSDNKEMDDAWRFAVEPARREIA